MKILTKQQQKKRHKNTRGLRFTQNPFFKIFISFPALLISNLLNIIKKYPKTFLFSVVLCISILSVNLAIDKINNLIEAQLPVTITVNNIDTDLQSRIIKTTHQLLAEAKQNHWTRSRFLNNLQQQLTDIEALDTCRYRLNFIGNLHIYATPHTPAFLAYTTNDSKLFLISKRMTIMGKGNDLNLTVPTVHLPEAKVSLKLKPKKYFISDANLPKIYRSITTIQKYYQNLITQGFKIVNYEYKTPSGMSFLLEYPESIKKATLEIILGDNQLEERISRSLQLLQELSNKKEQPEQIDLNYADKAIIKMKLSETTNSTVKF